MELKICHLYPDILNLYGDLGNVLCLRRRLEWRGIESSVTRVPLGSPLKLSDYDMLFIGGGQDFEHELLAAELKRGSGAELRAAIGDGLCVLSICGGFQMLGKTFKTAEGKGYDFAGVLDMYTVAGKERMTGDYKFRCGDSASGSIVVGFENHSGKTYLAPSLSPLGTVINGHGNNGEDGSEGVHYKNCYGSYSHGPLLPKNPQLCDHILLTALERKYGRIELAPLDDKVELAAHDFMCARV